MIGIYVRETFPRPKKKPFDGLEEITGVHIRLGIMPVPTSQTENLIIQSTQKDHASLWKTIIPTLSTALVSPNKS